MAAGQERKEPEIFAQEVQEGKEAAGRHIHTIRIKSNIDPEKAWLYNARTDYNSLTPEQKKEYDEHLKALPEKFAQMKKTLRELLDSIYSKEAVKIYQNAAEVLRQEKDLTAEEKADLEEIESYLHGYEQYKEIIAGDITEDITENKVFSEIIPSSPALHFAQQLANSLGAQREIKADKNTVISWDKTQGNTWTATRKNGKSIVSITFDDINLMNKKFNKGFLKLFIFTLKKCNDQNYRAEIGFSLQELIDKGMYKSIQSARRGFKDNIEKIMALTFKGECRKGKNKIVEAGGKLIYHYEIKNNYVTLSLNDKLNVEFLAQFFTVMPEYSYSLNTAAFSLMYYIFFRARQSTKEIADKEKFNIKLETIRSYLLLPTADETKNHAYLIREPIEKAIEEIELANNNKDFTLTLYHYDKDKGKKIEDCKNINEWLNCYLEVGLHGNYAKYFISIASATREKIATANKRKEKAMQKVIEKQIENASK